MARQQLDSGEELEITWNGNEYEVYSIDYNITTKFNIVAEINDEYNIYL